MGGSLDWIEQSMATEQGEQYIVMIDVLGRTCEGASDDLEMHWNDNVIHTATTEASPPSQTTSQSPQLAGSSLTTLSATSSIIPLQSSSSPLQISSPWIWHSQPSESSAVGLA